MHNVSINNSASSRTPFPIHSSFSSEYWQCPVRQEKNALAMLIYPSNSQFVLLTELVLSPVIYSKYICYFELSLSTLYRIGFINEIKEIPHFELFLDFSEANYHRNKTVAIVVVPLVCLLCYCCKSAKTQDCCH